MKTWLEFVDIDRMLKIRWEFGTPTAAVYRLVRQGTTYAGEIQMALPTNPTVVQVAEYLARPAIADAIDNAAALAGLPPGRKAPPV